MKRAPSFGYGKRVNFAFQGMSPSPNRYDLPCLFKERQLKGLAYTFGIAREAYTKVYLKAHPYKDTNVPGPGTYQVRTAPGQDQSKYTFRPKTTNLSIFLYIISIKCLNSGVSYYLKDTWSRNL